LFADVPKPATVQGLAGFFHSWEFLGIPGNANSTGGMGVC
jgi:hypothetical protein